MIILRKEFSDKKKKDEMSDKEFEAASKKVGKNAAKAAAGIGGALAATVAGNSLAMDAVGDHISAKKWANLAKQARGSKNLETTAGRHALAKFDISTARRLSKNAKLKGAGAVAMGATAVGGLAYAGKKLHDIKKQEKDPRFAKKLEKVSKKED